MYIDKKIKDIGDEFRAMNIVNDKCFEFYKKDKSFKMAVPLSCLVYYKGFKGIVTVKPPPNLV